MAELDIMEGLLAQLEARAVEGELARKRFLAQVSYQIQSPLLLVRVEPPITLVARLLLECIFMLMVAVVELQHLYHPAVAGAEVLVVSVRLDKIMQQVLGVLLPLLLPLLVLVDRAVVGLMLVTERAQNTVGPLVVVA